MTRLYYFMSQRHVHATVQVPSHRRRSRRRKKDQKKDTQEEKEAREAKEKLRKESSDAKKVPGIPSNVHYTYINKQANTFGEMSGLKVY